MLIRILVFKWLILLLIPGLFVFIITKVTNAEVSAREKWTSLIFRGLLFLSSFALQILILVHEFTFLSDDHFPFKGLDTVKNFLKIQGSDYFISQWIISAILQSVLFGWYIFSGYHLFKFYVTEVSSAKVNTGNKNFLKFKITDSEIVIYVVRIKKLTSG